MENFQFLSFLGNPVRGGMCLTLNHFQELRRRKVYMRGNIFVKCSERGLTDPFKGGDVKMKSFMDSLKHACKVSHLSFFKGNVHHLHHKGVEGLNLGYVQCVPRC